MLDILFFSRRSSHYTYFKKLSDAINLHSQVHIIGTPTLLSFHLFAKAFEIKLTDIIEQQLFRKSIAHPKLFSFFIVRQAYSATLHIIERLRLMKYLTLLVEEKPKKVALWNGQKLPNATIVQVAKYLKIDIVFFENGLLPNTTTCDYSGVNAKNSLPKKKEFYIDLELSDTKLLNTLIVRPMHKRRKVEAEIKLPKRYLFLPFQVPNDTQIVVNSPWIKSMEQLLIETVNALVSLNDETIYLVVKEHPSWKLSHKHLHNKHSNVVFANGNNTENLIKGSLGVITINSTVGIEALLLNKKVITLGDACYNIDGLVQHACDQRTLKYAIKNLELWHCDQLLRDKFLSFISKVYAIPTKWSQADDDNFLAIESRLRNNDLYSHYLNCSK